MSVDDPPPEAGSRFTRSAGSTGSTDVPPAAGYEGWDDATLVGRAGSGNDDAFSELVRRYQAPLFRHVWRLTLDRTLAEDVTQDAFLTAWRRLPSLARPAAFRGWLYQIATYRSIDLLRRRRPQQSLDVVGAGGPGEPVSGAPGPAVVHEQRAELGALEAALAALPVDLRAAWSMREIDEMSYDEIAAALTVPVSTVRGRIARARRDLAERMGSWQTTRD